MEFWGTTPPSLLSCTGFLVGLAGSFLFRMHSASLILSLVGFLLLVGGIGMNLRKGLNIRWRKLNLGFHVGFLVIVVCCTIAAIVINR